MDFGTLGCSLMQSLDLTSEQGKCSCEMVSLIGCDGWRVDGRVGWICWRVGCVSSKRLSI